MNEKAFWSVGILAAFLAMACSSADDGPADGDAGFDAGLDAGDGADGFDAGLDASDGADGTDGADASDAGLGDDGGEGEISFEEIAPPGGYVSSIAFHPSDPAVVWAGLDDSGGLYKSVDRGATWQLVPTGRQNWSAWDVAVDPDDPQVITTADAYGHGVLRSEDGGATWQVKNTGLTLQDPDRRVRALVVDPSDPSKLYIGTGTGVYKSIDGADSWTMASTGLPAGATVFRLAIDPDTPQRLYAGLDGGAVWRTLDGGGQWSLVVDLMPGLDQVEFWDLVVSPSNPDWVIAAVSDQVQLSTDGGDGWAPIAVGSFAGLGGIPIGLSATFDPANELIIYLGTFRLNGNNRRLRSQDGGANFQDISGPWGHEGVFRLRVSPHDSDLLVAGMVGDGIQVSPDAGQSWQRHTGAPKLATAPASFAQAPSNPDRIFMHGSFSLARTNDGGGAWDRLPAPEMLSKYMAVHPENPNLVLFAPLFLTGQGVYRSEDGGDTWQQRPINGVAPMAISFDSNDPDVVYVAGYKAPQGNFGIYRSSNAGVDWELLTPDWWFNTLVPSGVIEHPDRDGKLLVTSINGIYQSNPEQTEFTLLAHEGVNLLDMAVLPGGLWVVGGDEVAFVKDGAEWIQHDFPGSKAYTVLLDPNRPDRVLIGVTAWDKEFTAESTTGLFLSEDRGRNFSKVTENLWPSDQIYHLILDGGAPDTYLFSVYSAAGGLYRVHIP